MVGQECHLVSINLKTLLRLRVYKIPLKQWNLIGGPIISIHFNSLQASKILAQYRTLIHFFLRVMKSTTLDLMSVTLTIVSFYNESNCMSHIHESYSTTNAFLVEQRLIFTISRKNGIVFQNLVLPILILGWISVLSTIIPSDSGKLFS